MYSFCLRKLFAAPADISDVSTLWLLLLMLLMLEPVPMAPEGLGWLWTGMGEQQREQGELGRKKKGKWQVAVWSIL